MIKKKTEKKQKKKQNNTTYLNKKHELFALEFIKDMNATRAYKEVYWATQKVAEVNWCKLLSNTKVAEFIKTKIDEKFKKANIDWDWVIDTLKELVERCMQRKPIMIRKWRTMVQKTESYTDPETWEEMEVWVRWFDSAWANSALDKLAKYYKLYTDWININKTYKIEKVERSISS